MEATGNLLHVSQAGAQGMMALTGLMGHSVLDTAWGHTAFILHTNSSCSIFFNLLKKKSGQRGQSSVQGQVLELVEYGHQTFPLILLPALPGAARAQWIPPASALGSGTSQAPVWKLALYRDFSWTEADVSSAPGLTNFWHRRLADFLGPWLPHRVMG